MQSRKIWSLLMIIALMLGMATSLSACGRRGSLELSPEAQEKRASMPTAETRKGKIVVDRPFFLDPLL